MGLVQTEWEGQLGYRLPKTLRPARILDWRVLERAPPAADAMTPAASAEVRLRKTLSNLLSDTGNGGPRWTRTTYLRVISTALCLMS